MENKLYDNFSISKWVNKNRVKIVSQKVIEFSVSVRQALKENWGDKASTLNCYAEVKLIDLLSSWACYIFAMDESEEMIQCLMYSDAMGPELYTMRMFDVQQMYNEHGESPVIDKEYRKTKVIELLRRLRNDL